MNNVLKYMGVFFLFVFGAILGMYDSVEAFTLSPLRYSFVVDPGKTAVAEIEVWNNEAQTIEVVPEIDAFLLDPDTGHAQFGESDIAKSWVQTNGSVFTLVPGQKQKIVFTIAVPEGSRPESHYLGFFLKQKNSPGQIGIGKRIGTLVFLHVSGEMVEKMQLQDFSVLRDNNKKFFHIQAVNDGTIHLTPQGSIRLSNWRGKKIADIPLNPEQRKVLPGGIWKIDKEIQPPTFKNIGRIRADLVMTFGLTEQVLMQRIYFWFFPWWFVVIVIGVFAVGASGIYFLKKNYDRKKTA